jgi:hypothetical protein
MMIREEEDDMTQVIRQAVMVETQARIDKVIQKIEESKVPIKDEWTDGLTVGMEWAIRILRGDKSAS